MTMVPSPAAHCRWSNTSTCVPIPVPGVPAQPSPAGSLLDALPGLHLPPEAVPQPGAEPALLHAQEDTGRLHHQDEGEDSGRVHGSWVRDEAGTLCQGLPAPLRGDPAGAQSPSVPKHPAALPNARSLNPRSPRASPNTYFSNAPTDHCFPATSAPPSQSLIPLPKSLFLQNPLPES